MNKVKYIIQYITIYISLLRSPDTPLSSGIGHYGGGRYGGGRYGGRRYGGGHYGGNLPKGGHYGGKERVTHISEIFEFFFHKIRYTAI